MSYFEIFDFEFEISDIEKKCQLIQKKNQIESNLMIISYCKFIHLSIFLLLAKATNYCSEKIS